MSKTSVVFLCGSLLLGSAFAQLKPVENGPKKAAVENATPVQPGTRLDTRPPTSKTKPATGTPSTPTQPPAAPPANPTQKGTGKPGDK